MYVSMFWFVGVIEEEIIEDKGYDSDDRHDGCPGKYTH